MEERTVNNSARLAKCAENEAARLAKCAENEALLARLARKLNQDGIKPYQLPSDEFHAYIETTIDAARVPSERGKDRTRIVAEPDDDDELVAVPARRQRKPSLTKALREAKKAGISVTGATFTADSVSLSFGEAAKSNGNDLDQWLAGRHENPTKGH
jgi:hypothetical protein